MDYIPIISNNEQEVRDDFLFSLNNSAVVFRTDAEHVKSEDSRDYRIVYGWRNGYPSPMDFLSYLIVLHETYQIELSQGDVIGVKSNGKIVCYRLYSLKEKDLRDIWSYFSEKTVSGFTDKEKTAKIREIHSKNHVFDIIECREIDLGSLNLKRTDIYALDGESFYPMNGDKSHLIITDYSLFKYEHEKMQVKKINPYSRPFLSFQAAFTYIVILLKEKANKKRKALLLLNRDELYLVRDYYQLAAYVI